MLPSLHEQLEVALRALELLYPDQIVERLVVYLQCGARVVLPVLLPRSGQPPAPPFKPSELQEAILEALADGPLVADRLAERAGYDRRTLYRKPGGIQELLDQSLVIKTPDGYALPG